VVFERIFLQEFFDIDGPDSSFEGFELLFVVQVAPEKVYHSPFGKPTCPLERCGAAIGDKGVEIDLKQNSHLSPLIVV